MPKITGRVEVLLNGELLLNKSGASISGVGISGEPNLELEPVLGDTGIHGFKETPQPAICEVAVTDRDDVKLDKLARVREDGTVIFRTAGGGKVYTMHNATCARNFKLTAGEGEVALKFFGTSWVETTSDT